jgi:hypothetical protein
VTIVEVTGILFSPGWPIQGRSVEGVGKDPNESFSACPEGNALKNIENVWFVKPCTNAKSVLLAVGLRVVFD